MMFKIYSYILSVLSAFSLICFIIEFLQSKETLNLGFGFSFLIYVIFALIMRFLPERKSIFNDTNIQLLILWIITSIFAAIPIYMYHYTYDSSTSFTFISALFESVSGITSTGLSMYKDVEHLDKSILLWRSSLQWLGGLGVVVWVSFFFSEKDLINRYSSHEIGLKKTKEDEYRGPSLVIFYYVITSFILFLLLYTAGLTIWESINYTMSIFSTGGFSIYNDSLSRFSDEAKIVSLIFMFISSVNLYLVANSFKELKPFRILKNRYFIQYTLLILFTFTLLITLTKNYLSIDSLVNFISAATTTGAYAKSIGEYENTVVLILSLVMFIGAMTGSTAGGLRQKNLYFFSKGFYVLILKRNFEELSEDAVVNIRKSFLAVFSWIIMIIFSVIILTYFDNQGNDVLGTFFNVVSALTNTGLSLGEINYSSPDSCKIIYTFLMVVGRINISTLIMLLFLFVTKTKKKATFYH